MENVNSAAKRFPGFGNNFFIILFFGFCLILGSQSSSFADNIKKPNVSGAFYPADPKALSDKIDTFLKQAEISLAGKDIIALISAHAGYDYSGAVAAYGFKSISGKNYKTAVVIAPSHYYGFSGISVWPDGKFITPLGDINVDSEFASRIIKSTDRARFVPEAFAKEHSLEVQLPFLQKALPGVKIVPIIMGMPNLSDAEVLASVLKEIIGQKNDILVIASTDLSHFHPYQEAVVLDKRTIGYFEKLDSSGLWDKVSSSDVELCGLGPVLTVLIYAKERNAELKILKYANSSDVTGDLTSVVGYVSAVIYKKENNSEENKMLTIEQKRKLLKIARDSMESYVKTKKRITLNVDDPALRREQGAFVTLNKNGDLRGCIGRIVSDSPLCEVVAEMAVEAAVGDPRFSPVTKDEIKDIRIEISALSPLEEIKDVNKIEVGRHGIIIRRGFYSGLLLPQVATEYGWDRETFLAHSCQKAGLPADAWKDKATQIHIFSAEVFSEESIK